MSAYTNVVLGEEDGVSLRGRRKSNVDEGASRHWSVLADDPQISEGSHVPMYASMDTFDGSGGTGHRRLSDEDSHLKQSRASGRLAHLQGDIGNICLLLVLYVLQGIPLGLTASIPLVLQSRHVSYAEQAMFSLAYWPFSLKLLWAPVVDSWYWSRLGRRKSWLVPTQYLIALFMWVLSMKVTSILGDSESDDSQKPSVLFLTSVFFLLNFLAATQDVAVDGWALTMLSKNLYVLLALLVSVVLWPLVHMIRLFSRINLILVAELEYSAWPNVNEFSNVNVFNGFLRKMNTGQAFDETRSGVDVKQYNVGYASTCNAVGQTAGWFIGNVVFLSLESAEFCNKYLRTEPQPMGVVTLANFVYFWAVVFAVTTTVVLIFKKEKQSVEDTIDDMGIVGTYKLVWDIIRLKPVLMIILVHLTAKIGFSAPDSITGLKLVEKGVPKDKLAFLAIPLVPLQIILPWLIGKWTAGPRPLDVYVKAYPFRLIFGLVFPLIIYWTPDWQLMDGTFPTTFYALLIAVYCLHQVTLYSIFVATMSFAAQISDPLVGGTYMTLLNTVANLGSNWPSTVSLSIVDDITWKDCFNSTTKASLGPCTTDEACTSLGGKCTITTDGYYILCVACTVIGVIWWLVMGKRMRALQRVPKQDWSTRTPAKAKAKA